MAKPTRLAKAQRNALERLRQVPGLDRFYLAGGTAIAVHLGHRRSLDLDLFSLDERIDLVALRRRLARALPDMEVVAATDAALAIQLEGTLVDLVKFPYPPIVRPGPGPAGTKLAALSDLAAMNLSAIAQRGLRRDFWDLYVIVRSGRVTLREAARAYVRKFRTGESGLYHVARALTWFVDAERDPDLPLGLSEQKWRAIKAYFEREAPSLLAGRAAARRPTAKK